MKMGSSYEIPNQWDTFTEGVSNRYADPIEVAGLRDSSIASSLSSISWSSSSSAFLSSEVMSNGCLRPFSSASLSAFPVN